LTNKIKSSLKNSFSNISTCSKQKNKLYIIPKKFEIADKIIYGNIEVIYNKEFENFECVGEYAPIPVIAIALLPIALTEVERQLFWILFLKLYFPKIKKINLI
jgi:hypothetical protein